MQNSVSLILPTLNERENILPVLDSLLEIRQISEILIVDDNSADGTADLVAMVYRGSIHSGRLRIISRTGTPGLSASLREGVSHSRSSILGWMDADGSMPAEKIPEMLIEIEKGADVCIGSRFLTGGHQKEFMKSGKDHSVGILLSTLFNFIARRKLGLPYTDFTSGFLLAKKETLREFNWNGDHGEYFLHLLAHFYRTRAKVIELPYTCHQRKNGVSKTHQTPSITFRNLLRYATAFYQLY